MKLYPISIYNPSINVNKAKNKNSVDNPLKNQNATITDLSAMPYFGFVNLSFKGRTPEDFYAQGFNREAMPFTMKTYLYQDYDKWQHVPPEQLMNKAFNEVKELYPNEPLFENLRDNAKAISSVAYEIKVARDLSDEPLFKNGDDNFGVYLLRKIYLEGKTIKEIDICLNVSISFYL